MAGRRRGCHGRRAPSRCLIFAALGVAAAGAPDASCKGYRYGGIDWDALRSTLEVYADKYLDRPQLIAEELQLAAQYGLEYHPENECVLGDLALRFLLWLQLGREQLRVAVASVVDGAPASTGAGPILEEAYSWFWELKLTWHEVLASGWPLFSILAAAAEQLRDDSIDACVRPEVLQLYQGTFDDAHYVPMHVSAATLLDAAACPEAVATALASLADGARSTARPGVNRDYLFSSMPPPQQPPEAGAEELLRRAEALLRRDRSWRLLRSPWPVFRSIDRLGAAPVAAVSAGPGLPSFLMHVFPHRVRSDGLISNRIRGTASAYCLQLFQDELLRLATEQPARTLRVVDAGPHIGDCPLWSAAVLGKRARVLAVEPVWQVVRLFRQSIASNGFDIDVRHAWLGSKSTVAQTEHEAPWLKLDDALREDIDILKIHTNGGERAILDGAARLFREHRVRVVLVHSAEPEQLWGSAAFLLERRYEVQLVGRRLGLQDESFVKDAVRSRGGLQLHALAP